MIVRALIPFVTELVFLLSVFVAGIFASIAALMFNCVNKEDIDYSPYEEGEWRLAVH